MQFSDHIQPIFNVRAGVAICKLNSRVILFQLFLAVKKIMLLEIAKWYFV